MRLVFSRQAKADIDAIWTYIASESGSAEVADRVADSLNKTLIHLRHSPGIERTVNRTFVQDCAAIHLVVI